MVPRTPYEIAVEQFNIAVQYLDLEPGMADIMRVPKRELTVHFPVKMDDGSIQVFTGYRVQHSHGLRPGQGRHPLPPRREPGRGQGPGDVDDAGSAPS